MKLFFLNIVMLFLCVLTANSQNLFPSTGNVGIGTSSPSALLHVNTGNIKVSNPTGYPNGVNVDVNFPGTWAREFGISYNSTGKLASFGVLGLNGTVTYAYIGGNTSAAAANESPWMVFKPNGYVGIGTIAPGARLSVETSDSTTDNFVRLENKGVTNSLLYIGSASTVFPVIEYRKKNVIESYSDLHISAANAGSNLYFETGRLSAAATIRMTINSAGNVGIGTTTPGSYKLAVEGTIGARRMKVTQGSWADFVFHPDYELPTLQEVERFIKANRHLPEIPSAREVESDGLDVGEMNKKLLQKIEELTLYMIEMKKESIVQRAELEALKKEMKRKN